MHQKMDVLVEVGGRVEQTVDSAIARWRDMPDERLRFRPSEDAWSAKEIIGHLSDTLNAFKER